MKDNKSIVLDAFKNAGKPLKPGDVAELTGLDKNDVDKAIKELKSTGELISPKRCFYAPAE